MTEPKNQVEGPDREAIRTAWDRIAAGYDAHVTPTHFQLADKALARAGVDEGVRFLDVAAGSGGLTIPALRKGAHVTSVDISSVMMAQLEARALREGLRNITTRVMDGQALELEDESFDVSGSQFGVMLFPDLPQGLREMTRVTRPGGKVLIVAFGPPEKVEFIDFLIRALKHAEPKFAGLPDDPPPLPFQVADPEKLRLEMASAGLADIELETVTENQEFGTGDDLWNWLMYSNPIPGTLISGFSEEQKAVAREAMAALIRQRAGSEEAAVLTSSVHVAVGRK